MTLTEQVTIIIIALSLVVQAVNFGAAAYAYKTFDDMTLYAGDI